MACQYRQCQSPSEWSSSFGSNGVMAKHTVTQCYSVTYSLVLRIVLINRVLYNKANTRPSVVVFKTNRELMKPFASES